MITKKKKCQQGGWRPGKPKTPSYVKHEKNKTKTQSPYSLKRRFASGVSASVGAVGATAVALPIAAVRGVGRGIYTAGLALKQGSLALSQRQMRKELKRDLGLKEKSGVRSKEYQAFVNASKKLNQSKSRWSLSKWSSNGTARKTDIQMQNQRKTALAELNTARVALGLENSSATKRSNLVRELAKREQTLTSESNKKLLDKLQQSQNINTAYLRAKEKTKKSLSKFGQIAYNTKQTITNATKTAYQTALDSKNKKQAFLSPFTGLVKATGTTLAQSGKNILFGSKEKREEKAKLESSIQESIDINRAAVTADKTKINEEFDKHTGEFTDNKQQLITDPDTKPALEQLEKLKDARAARLQLDTAINSKKIELNGGFTDIKTKEEIATLEKEKQTEDDNIRRAQYDYNTRLNEIPKNEKNSANINILNILAKDNNRLHDELMRANKIEAILDITQKKANEEQEKQALKKTKLNLNTGKPSDYLENEKYIIAQRTKLTKETAAHKVNITTFVPTGEVKVAFEAFGELNNLRDDKLAKEKEILLKQRERNEASNDIEKVTLDANIRRLQNEIKTSEGAMQTARYAANNLRYKLENNPTKSKEVQSFLALANENNRLYKDAKETHKLETKLAKQKTIITEAGELAKTHLNSLTNEQVVDPKTNEVRPQLDVIVDRLNTVYQPYFNKVKTDNNIDIDLKNDTNNDDQISVLTNVLKHIQKNYKIKSSTSSEYDADKKYGEMMRLLEARIELHNYNKIYPQPPP